MHYVIPTASKIIITKHAQRRFVERFRLYFSSIRITSTFLWENLMIAQISKGHICYNWRMVPFYVNKVESEYGKTVVIKRKPCYYICTPTSTGKLAVRTVVSKWYND
jgi:hypothetical protein